MYEKRAKHLNVEKTDVCKLLCSKARRRSDVQEKLPNHQPQPQTHAHGVPVCIVKATVAVPLYGGPNTLGCRQITLHATRQRP